MIEIYFTACLMSYLTQCRDVTLTFFDESPGLTPYECNRLGLIEIASWMETHPNWYLKRWTVRPARQFGKA